MRQDCASDVQTSICFTGSATNLTLPIETWMYFNAKVQLVSADFPSYLHSIHRVRVVDAIFFWLMQTKQHFFNEYHWPLENTYTKVI